MHRKIMSRLLNWKEKHSKTALVLSGARQTGKTFILKEFCKENFKNSLYINFEEDEKYKGVFEGSLVPEEIVRRIELLRGERIEPENTAIFFDEVQACEKALASLKYFNESTVKYKIVCAGSLLGITLNRIKSSFPVGGVYFEQLYPMDLEEFLLARGDAGLSEEIKVCYRDDAVLNPALHTKALEIYREYLCVGGMPRSVLEFLSVDKSLAAFDRTVQSSTVKAYLADMAKYSGKENTVKLTHVYDCMPAQLAKENKKFSYKLVAGKASHIIYGSSIEWLLLSGLLLKSIKVELPQAPFSAFQSGNIFKLYLSDVGLLGSLSGLQFADIILDNGIMYKGILTENYIAQTFKANGHELYYWESKGLAEIDFLVNLGGKPIPVEVKASDNTRSRSLSVYTAKHKPEYSIRISSKNFGFNNGIKSVPLYSAHCIIK